MKKGLFGNIVLYHQIVLLDTILVALGFVLAKGPLTQLFSTISSGLFFVLFIWSIGLLATLLKQKESKKILYVVPVLFLLCAVFGIALGIYLGAHTSVGLSLLSSSAQLFRYLNYVILLVQAMITIYVIRKFNDSGL